MNPKGMSALDNMGFFFSLSAFNLSTSIILGLISSCALKIEPESLNALPFPDHALRKEHK